MAPLTLKDKNIIITGASRGLGAEITRSMWKAGANLMLVARNQEGMNSAISTLERYPRQKVYTLSVDLSSPDAPEKILSTAHKHFDALHVLVNNAAIQGPIGPAWENEWDAWNLTLRINLLAPVDLSRRCAAWMITQGEGKIICLSGGGATGSRPNFSAYAVSKTGLVRFCEILADELRPYNVQVNTIAPGVMATDILDEVLAAGPKRAGQKEYASAFKTRAEGGVPLERGTELAVFLASVASDGLTGKLISAVWDPWEQFPEHMVDLQKTDIYTLRRIVPKDRGQTWGEL